MKDAPSRLQPSDMEWLTDRRRLFASFEKHAAMLDRVIAVATTPTRAQVLAAIESVLQPGDSQAWAKVNSDLADAIMATLTPA
jgi:hypothetical protein